MTVTLWAPKWVQDNRLDGRTETLIISVGHHGSMFRTRRECREFIERKYGYIRTRPDLKAEPHGWRMPFPVRITIDEKETP